jgi:Lon protease-like protein
MEAKGEDGGVDLLPLLPLPTVLFPGGSLPVVLNGRERLAEVSDALETDSPIGVLLGREDLFGSAQGRAGTAARVVEARTSPEGGLKVLLVGTRRFVVEHLVPRGGRLFAAVRYPEEEAPSREGALLLRGLFGAYREAMALIGGAGGALPTDLPDYDPVLAYAVAERLAVPVAERQRLLDADGEARLGRAIYLVRRELDLLRLMEEDRGSA